MASRKWKNKVVLWNNPFSSRDVITWSADHVGCRDGAFITIGNILIFNEYEAAK